ncbi:MAG: hypothetical protein KKF62_00130 [Bacteroidetes bacterium]|nr:hypothetical protein [Bacteroidota bacterium]MBU1113909.1 hypothetical protein [Bacteroidota bacterium]MBU1798228.1 hypothetical protein [Bacteroidota bacterium]
MKKTLFTILVLMLLIVSSDLFAQLKITGDARFRPRLNIDDKTENNGTLTTDVYYMYRLRLNFNWNLGDGYFLQSRLGHNGIAGFGVFGKGLSPDALGTYGTDYAESARRMSVDVMLLNGGFASDNYGYKLGLFEAGAYNNPIFDVHYFAKSLIDIPFFIFNNDGLFGASAYYKAGTGKITLGAFYDNAFGKSVENAAGNEVSSQNDQYTFYADYNVKLANWSVQPMVMMTVADSAAAPITFGANITSPKLVGDLALDLSAIYSSNSVKQAEVTYTDYGMVGNEYTAWKVRAKVSGKLGIGSLFAYVELGNREDTFDNASTRKNDFLYSWLGYSFTVYKGEAGSFIITPEWRHIATDVEGVNTQTREKLEVNFDFKF